MMTSSMDGNAIVVDNGTGTIKAGFAGDDAPRSIFPTVIGKPMMPDILVALNQKDVYIGDEAIEKKGVVRLSHPIERGLIVDWEDIDKIWGNTIYQKLNGNPEEQAILLTQPPLNPKENKEKMAKIIFENFGVPFLYLGTQTVLSLYASGRTTGLVIDIGEGTTNVSPIYEAFAIPFSNVRLPLGGQDLTLYLQECMRRSIENQLVAEELEWIQWIKEKSCTVAPDYETCMKSIEKKKEVLPDGNTVVTLGNERYLTPEILFHPEIAGKDLKGIHEYAANSIIKCEQGIKKELYKSIILSGGSTQFPSMASRLKTELAKLVPPNTEVSILAPTESKYGVWFGGSIVAALSAFSSMYISRNDYNEIGPSVIHSKAN